MDSFYSEIKKEITNETIIERSKFICLIKRVETEEEKSPVRHAQLLRFHSA